MNDCGEHLDSLLGDSPRTYLRNVTTATDALAVDDGDGLTISGRSAEDLLNEFGSPLYVVSESTIRANFRRIQRAFTARWPTTVVVMYALKANNNPAIRAIIHQEGGGGDCFGLGELMATFRGGASPDVIAMNGGNKTFQELKAAVEHGIIVNVDADDEVPMLVELCEQLDRRVRVAVRLKSAPASLARIASDYMGTDDTQSFLKREKWGFSHETGAEVVTTILARERLDLVGFSLHTPRFTQDPRLFAECTRNFAEMIGTIAGYTGYVPSIIDIGGGWPRERDPESRSHLLNPFSIEDFAEHTTASMLSIFEAQGLPVPELRLEPGRYIVGNAAVLLGRVGVIRRDGDSTWVNIDASTNNLPRIDTSGSRYHLMPASGMSRRYTQRAQVVGPTCIDSRIVDDWPLPVLSRGEPVAILDAGMYAESASTQFNSIPRPATVLLSEGEPEIIRERESLEDVFAKTRVPERLKPVCGESRHE